MKSLEPLGIACLMFITLQGTFVLFICVFWGISGTAIFPDYLQNQLHQLLMQKFMQST